MDNHPGSSAHQVIFQNETISTSADGMAVSTTIPEKRRPGRPKGSGKKYPDGAPPKIKRPVGRPRKDGFPAGSVATSRSRKSALTGDPSSLTLGYFQHQDVKPVFHAFQDANFDGDDWLELSRTKPGCFINTLIVLLRADNPRSPAGTVEDAFKTHVNSLVTPANHTLPMLYSVLRTFWLPTSPTYFCLTASNATRPILEFRFLYWDPQPLVFNGIACPSCTTPLQNRGRIASGPVKIYDLEQPFFIIGCEYVCMSQACVMATTPEGRKFASTDPSILRSLPNTLADELPARLRQFDSDIGSSPEVWNWQAIGVSKALWNMVQGSLRSGVRKDVILQIVKSIQHGVTDTPPAAPVTGVLPSPPPPPAPPIVVEDELDDDSDEQPDEEDEMMDPDNSMPVPQHDRTPNGYKAYSTEPWKVTPHEPETQSNTQSTGPQTYMYPPPPPPPAAQQQQQLQQQQQFSPNLRFPPPYFATPKPPTPTMAGPSHQQMSPVSPPIDDASNKRAYPFALDGTEHVPVLSTEGPRKRSPRHCSKCGSADCKGKGGRSFCSNACRDCGKLECMGRTNRRNVCQNRNWN